MTFKHVTIGGTFDRLHKGHMSLIDYAFRKAQKVSIGLVRDGALNRKLFADRIESFLVRRKALLDYLQGKKYNSRAVIIPIHDFYGITLSDVSLDGVVVTKETRKNAGIINIARKKRGMKPLHIITIPFLKGSDRKIIRSTRIRSGEINRDGYYYPALFSGHKYLHLPSSLRDQLRQPLGRVVKGTDNESTMTAQKVITLIKAFTPPLVISVGDIITESLHEAGFIPDISIVDYKTQRHILPPRQNAVKSSHVNKAGTINPKALSLFRKSLGDYIKTHKKKFIVIGGEEDLLALPAILLAPLGTIVLYGQRDLGVVVTVVEEKQKEKVRLLLEQFI